MKKNNVQILKIMLLGILLVTNSFALGSDGETAFDKIGWYIETGEPDKAKKLAHEACNNNNQTACMFVVYFDDTLTKKQKQVKILQYAKKGCYNQNSGVACFYIAKINQNSNNPKTIELVKELSKKACELEYADACRGLGRYYYNTEYNPTLFNKYNELAIRFYKKGCNNGMRESCYQGARMYVHPKYGFKGNAYKAKELFQAGCNLNYDACCLELGFMYEYGEDIRQDKRRAKELYGKACDLGDKYSCYEYKRLNEAGY